MKSETETASFDAGGGATVSVLLDVPTNPQALLVLAHGAGAGMRHPFLAATASALAERGIAVFRYQFPYAEAGRKRVDTPAVAYSAVRAAVAAASQRVTGLPTFAGGKSFGGRMTSGAIADQPMGEVKGIVFLGFPLHPPGKPEAAAARAAHLARVSLPMLFLQGARDEFADLPLIKAQTKALGAKTTLYLIPDANHSFKVPAASGRKDADIRVELADTILAWMQPIMRPGLRHGR